ncbi:AMP-binding protein, partial [Nocardia farcinica]
AYRTSELEYVLGQAGVRMLVSAPEFKTSNYVAMIEQVRPECPGLEQVLILGTPEWEALAATAADHELLTTRAAELSMDDAINIQYTSGTTGFPKGATLSHHNILNNGYFVGELCGY